MKFTVDELPQSVRDLIGARPFLSEQDVISAHAFLTRPDVPLHSKVYRMCEMKRDEIQMRRTLDALRYFSTNADMWGDCSNEQLLRVLGRKP